MSKIRKYGNDWTWEELTVIRKVAKAVRFAGGSDVFIIDDIRGAITSKLSPNENVISKQKDIDADNKQCYPADIQMLVNSYNK